MTRTGSFQWLRAFLVLAVVVAFERARAQASGSATTVTVTVPSDQPWTDSGLLLTTGQSLTVSATGSIYVGALSNPALDYESPNGQPWPNCASGTALAFIAPGLPCWSLIGRIGASGAAFEIGASATFIANSSGELYLGVNDSYFADNSGAWSAMLTEGSSLSASSCYGSLLSGSPPTLSASVQSINSNGTVVVNGVDTAQPNTPFQFTWGDGSSTSGFFPQQHVYANTSQNYVITVTASENNGTTQQYSVPVFFTPPQVTPRSIPGISFQIPSQSVQLQTHWPYPPPSDVTFFGDSSFPAYSRSDVAYILAAISSIDYNFANNNSFLLNGVFQIDMLENTSYGGGLSFWWTTPMSVGYGASLVNPSPQWYLSL